MTNKIFEMLPEDCSSLTYVDPFFGGGGAYLNLPREFKAYECSDILPYAIDFFSREYRLGELQAFEDRVGNTYDLDVKVDYYEFRGWWNKALKEKTYPHLINIGFVMLAQHCVNHLVRFGPNGFNQGWGGKRGKVGPKWGAYCEARRPNSQFFARDFMEVSLGSDVLLYLDPPYSGTELAIYGQHWTDDDDERVLELIQAQTEKGGPWVLSSPLIANGQPGKLVKALADSGAQVIPIERTYKSSVGPHKRKDSKEAVVYGGF